ncbi:hypothetical protein DBR24_01325 [Pseudomonas sp. HMWF006]|nr:hypothetical protein DBR24_01325 [Pseudomonas sp. HMWF006]PTT69561.1 hypothetical protein DBR26_11335 [Pseudomonas sp. HMWF007]PTT92704.1 hypothetical protein DBR29_08620 [Pseudomonas sp. HMWF005]
MPSRRGRAMSHAHCRARWRILGSHARHSLGVLTQSSAGGFYLSRLDVALMRPDVFYLRYMDDVLVLAPTRNKLRQAVRVVNDLFEEFDLQKHPDKTYVGRIERGFTFLGKRYPRPIATFVSFCSSKERQL